VEERKREVKTEGKIWIHDVKFQKKKKKGCMRRRVEGMRQE
jgi:hypothetical protein